MNFNHVTMGRTTFDGSLSEDFPESRSNGDSRAGLWSTATFRKPISAFASHRIVPASGRRHHADAQNKPAAAFGIASRAHRAWGSGSPNPRLGIDRAGQHKRRAGGMSGIEISVLLDKSKELDQLRKEQEEVHQEINKIHKKLQSSPEASDAILIKLRQLYCHAKDLSEHEVSASNALMSQLDALLQSGLSAAQRKKIVSEKKKRMKSDSDIARFPPTASMRSQLEHAANLKGEQVAARVSSDDAEKDEWFIVKVINFDKDTKEFEVFDEEPGDDEESAQRKYKLPMSHIIPFPKKNDPSSAPDFPPGRHVLAVYPGTTALYKATVVNSHRKRKSDEYLLEFDDDEEDGSLPQRSVQFYKVVPLPEGHRQ
ncbi:SGF29 tudor-like domain [Musa troglodytarum]|uniref:SGF29 tudor-like domain n=1 Tax=Musa troglodytarum TaxID=320322 RepID=A0A9E7G5Q2_9LILI|nr:SGF29 tudor-like domain [Musa troglodytarum]